MPKKFHGENSKAAEARARQDAVKQEAKARKEKEDEDKLWEDNDKHVQRKLERKDEKERKQQETLQKKLEREKLLEEETSALKGAKPAPVKVTRAQIDAHVQARQDLEAKIAAQAPKDKSLIAQTEDVLHENLNREIGEGHHARNVDEALAVLSVKDAAADMEKHPERRMKAAYLAFEEREMARLKKEYPDFRLSQLKQMLKKEWQKSPDNPFNQPTQKFNSKPSESA
ncbi:coiled-coil domain-containing protein 124-like isoform X1 [Paramacrobiotus metropolitanus]|uniref:coiled-coil domain-containing protein 124-like isoform X1 n=1 Tax=Paramacrobiotus metropolitanus TaxID=2943436 RepID=UPI0024458FED|nr:coiled-coil domain-containing protein 124-like isoform X1 [Paramacrobiotus metropolitanus]